MAQYSFPNHAYDDNWRHCAYARWNPGEKCRVYRFSRKLILTAVNPSGYRREFGGGHAWTNGFRAIYPAKRPKIHWNRDNNPFIFAWKNNGSLVFAVLKRLFFVWVFFPRQRRVANGRIAEKKFVSRMIAANRRSTTARRIPNSFRANSTVCFREEKHGSPSFVSNALLPFSPPFTGHDNVTRNGRLIVLENIADRSCRLGNYIDIIFPSNRHVRWASSSCCCTTHVQRRHTILRARVRIIYTLVR